MVRPALLLGLVVLAAAIRAVRIGESLWYDELSVLFDYLLYGPGAVAGNYFVSSNHVAHSLLTWCAMDWFGDRIYLPTLGFLLRYPLLGLGVGVFLLLFTFAVKVVRV